MQCQQVTIFGNFQYQADTPVNATRRPRPWTKRIGVGWEDWQGEGQASVAVTRLGPAVNGSPLSI